MKLTRNLAFAIGLGIFLVLGFHALVRTRYDRDVYRADMRRDHVVLGRSIATLVEMLWEIEGSGRALEAVEHQNRRTGHVQIRWVEGGPSIPSGDVPLRLDLMRARPRRITHAIVRYKATLTMLTYVPVRVPGRIAALELVEALDGEREAQRRSLVRTATTAGTLLVVSVILTIGFGVFFVARPLRKIMVRAAEVGEGKLEGRIAITQNDEIRELAEAFDRMVERLKASRETEEEAVASRIRALEQLRHADRLKTIGELASGVAHEFGTPLNVVRARGSMIASGEVTEPRMRELGGVIVEQVDRMSVIIRRLLDYARRSSSVRTETPTEAVVQAVGRMLAPIAARKQVELVVDVEPGAGRCVVDPTEIQHALTNLVVNAIDASREGGKVCLRAEGDEGEARIVVRDEGTGIAAKDLPHVLEPFFTTKGLGEGTGLGLAIAAEIVREHGGTLSIASEEGRGTEVTLRLPRRSDDAAIRDADRRGFPRAGGSAQGDRVE